MPTAATTLPMDEMRIKAEEERWMGNARAQ